MGIDFNHTILATRDAQRSALFLAEMLGLRPPRRWGPFWMVVTDNGVNLDYIDVEHAVVPQHYAFLVDDTSFGALHNRLVKRNLHYWADPQRQKPGMNDHDGGRGLYFNDLNGHLLEMITRPYGSGGWNP
ncbi:VOC family protein [Ochrobactrum quorumnocens]|jgi:catechol 2,3-dioxygenase-like lactoylglutathione lyase family enzyme|uniref:VOC family protein n=1 Tax=Ochrobactrum quorumnocens TaxID=271865 RepID=A0A5N1JGF3_9HYPH|nr:VOC family protein [[Ochrobactrum] quorumnocens]KAA9354275.1 VOC family protein [[Ochrobactrum] quorumnocens]